MRRRRGAAQRRRRRLTGSCGVDLIKIDELTETAAAAAAAAAIIPASSNQISMTLASPVFTPRI